MVLKIIFNLDSETVEHYTENPLTDYRYSFRSSLSIVHAIREELGFDDIAFLTPRSLVSDQQLYGVKDGLFVPIDGDISADLLLILGVDTADENFGLDSVAKQYEQYASLEPQIGRFINPLASKFIIDKRDIYKVPGSHLFPRLYDSSSWNALEREVLAQGSVVVKHRMGADGKQVYLVTPENFSDYKTMIGDALDEHIAQETLAIDAEKRVLIYGGNIVATRIIRDRSRPWEKTRTYTGGNIVDDYEATPGERRVALELFEQCGLDYGAVDFAVLGPQHACKQKVLEVNGIHPGMIGALQANHRSIGKLYDLGPTFIRYIESQL
jgi:hypothetical protein